jgi:hypothetical protein
LALAILAGACGPLCADEHLVDPVRRDALLAGAAHQRSHDLAVTSALLATPVARQALDSLGIRHERISAAVAALSDSELRNLAARAEALESDPVAGWSTKTWIILLVVALASFIVIGATGWAEP